MTDKAARDALADLIYRTLNPEIRQDDGWMSTIDGTGNVVSHIAADAILAAGWKPPGTTFDVCGHGRRPDESCILCERVAP